MSWLEDLFWGAFGALIIGGIIVILLLKFYGEAIAALDRNRDEDDLYG